MFGFRFREFQSMCASLKAESSRKGKESIMRESFGEMDCVDMLGVMKLIGGNPLGWSNPFYLNFNRTKINDTLSRYGLEEGAGGKRETDRNGKVMEVQDVLRMVRELSMITQAGSEDKKVDRLREMLDAYDVGKTDIDMIGKILLVV